LIAWFGLYMPAANNNPTYTKLVAAMQDILASHFGRLFRASTGVGPREMFANIRLERAAGDLCQSGKSITDISLDCGFSQPQHLATAFRRKFGLTPNEFRRKARS